MRVGKCAAEYVKNRYQKDLEEPKRIKVVTRENVNYLKPDYINKSDLDKEIIFTLRVSHPDRRMQIQVKDHPNVVIYVRRNRNIFLAVEIRESILDYLEILEGRRRLPN